MDKILKEAEGENSKTVNEVQLSDLHSAASKAEQSIINLCLMAVNFSSPSIKAASASLRSKAHDLTTLLMNTMMEENMPMANVEKPLPAPGDKQPIEKKDGQVLETASVEDKFIEESWKELTESNKNGKDARKKLAEAFSGQLKEINLKTVYEMVMEGACTFEQFKGRVYESLNSKSFGEEYKALVSEIKEATTPELYEVAMNKVYDFADANDIIIKTA